MSLSSARMASGGRCAAPLKFSFVVPTFSNNVGGYIKVARALDSVVRQTDNSCEIIIVNDGYDSIMHSIYVEYKRVCKDANIGIRYVQLPYAGDRGGHRNINFGIEHAVGDFVCILNGDNEVYPTYVAEMYLPEYDVVFCWVLMNDLPGMPVLTALHIIRTGIDRLNYAIKTSIAQRTVHPFNLDADYDFLVRCLDWNEGLTNTYNVGKVLAEHN